MRWHANFAGNCFFLHTMIVVAVVALLLIK